MKDAGYSFILDTTFLVLCSIFDIPCSIFDTFMRVYITADHMTTALGLSAPAHFEQLIAGNSGIRRQAIKGMSGEYSVSLVDDQQLDIAAAALRKKGTFTRLEKLLLHSVEQAITSSGIDPAASDTGFILSSTKGNIDLIDPEIGKAFSPDRIHLSSTAQIVKDYFENPNQPIVICNACISGVMAIIVGARMIRLGQYKQVIVSGADLVSPFTISGFEALKALSPDQCLPFDKDRTGINLGEGCGTVVLSATPQAGSIEVLGGSISNDANHISGPSRTGSGLQQAIKNAMEEAGQPTVDYISAHGTATVFNDEMEAKAFYALGLSGIPLNSFKGYLGHTLGAAGLLETIMTCHSLQQNTLIASAGYKSCGVSQPLNIIEKVQNKTLQVGLKTSSGFGGCNGALVLKKIPETT